MTREVLITSLRSIYAELFPYRNAAHWVPTDGEIVLAEMIRCGLEGKIDRLKPAYAEGAEPQASAKPRHAMNYDGEDA